MPEVSEESLIREELRRHSLALQVLWSVRESITVRQGKEVAMSSLRNFCEPRPFFSTSELFIREISGLFWIMVCPLQ